MVKNQDILIDNLRAACKKIAPVWPLERFVAVNPYLGQIDQHFDDVAEQLAAVGDIQMTLPIAFYLDKLSEGRLNKEDIAAVLKLKFKEEDINVDGFLNELTITKDSIANKIAISTVSDIASELTQIDWNRFMVARISNWAASYFDNGQATWPTSVKGKNIYFSWREEASIDRSADLFGLKGFRKNVSALPDEPIDAVAWALKKMDIPEEGLQFYLHRLLLRVGGWSACAARLDWDSQLYGGKDGQLIEFLAVLVCWEACLYNCIDNNKFRQAWSKSCLSLKENNPGKKLNQHLIQKLILQEAFDLAAQQEMINKFQNPNREILKQSSQSKAQAIFCIDVRSEVYRRNLELADSKIETLGFAGFFAFPIKYVPVAHESGEANCPVLLKTGPSIMEDMGDEKVTRRAVESRTFNSQLHDVWKSFKSGAVTNFSFVSPMGLSYLPKLFTDTFGLTRPVPHPDKAGLSNTLFSQKRISLRVTKHNHENVGIALEDQVKMAKNALRAMSLSDNFARFVLIVGHGSTTVNNPYATGLDCGACGGHTGEANAKVAAAVLNNQVVREALKSSNIAIPDSTIFLACLHDTTTDEIIVFNIYDVPSERKAEFDDLQDSLKKAGQLARTERSLRMAPDGNFHTDTSIKNRSKDWSQVRPEWGLAGCSSFVVAPRYRTKGIDFKGRSFLHSYEWRKDYDFSVLELIMTAPMVVTSWISLQYYASTVDNKNFGSGNKTLHNVTSGVGVLEGFSGDLRVGLPLQSVHDGEQFQHEPIKLNVIIEAPIDAMNDILKKHQSVRNLCDNGWLHLLSMNEEGQVSHRYAGDLKWTVRGY